MSKNRCANCKYFFDYSEPYASPDDLERFGLCRIILPPWVSETQDYRRFTNKNYVCDLHKPKEVQP